MVNRSQRGVPTFFGQLGSTGSCSLPEFLDFKPFPEVHFRGTPKPRLFFLDPLTRWGDFEAGLSAGFKTEVRFAKGC